MNDPKSYDEKIMQELLQQPGVREEVAKMTPAMLDWYKRLLVQEGHYARYLKDRQKESNK